LPRKELLEKLADCVSSYDIEGVGNTAKEVLKNGIDPTSAVENGLAKGLKVVGRGKRRRLAGSC
jgi:methanogenic corrinoid protein MtbC1